MDHERVEQVVRLFESRGQLDRISVDDSTPALECLKRASTRLEAARVLTGAGHWESAYTTAYDAYRTAADAVVLALGCRVPATTGAHRIAMDVAHAALHGSTATFAPPTAEQFREGRHESEYFDPDRPVDKTGEDAEWAIERARQAIDAVDAALEAM